MARSAGAAFSFLPRAARARRRDRSLGDRHRFALLEVALQPSGSDARMPMRFLLGDQHSQLEHLDEADLANLPRGRLRNEQVLALKRSLKTVRGWPRGRRNSSPGPGGLPSLERSDESWEETHPRAVWIRAGGVAGGLQAGERPAGSSDHRCPSGVKKNALCADFGRSLRSLCLRFGRRRSDNSHVLRQCRPATLPHAKGRT
jgi:hypothetical protein